MDDFRGCIPIAQLLNILDRYPVQLSVHGGYTWLKATKIIITSNVPVTELYKNVDIESRRALIRRIHRFLVWERDPNFLDEPTWFVSDHGKPEVTGNNGTVTFLPMKIYK